MPLSALAHGVSPLVIVPINLIELIMHSYVLGPIYTLCTIATPYLRSTMVVM